MKLAGILIFLIAIVPYGCGGGGASPPASTASNQGGGTLSSSSSSGAQGGGGIPSSGTSSSQSPAFLVANGPVQATYFGEDLASPADYQSVTAPFGGVRLWDSGTAWLDLETSRGTYDWPPLDAWLRTVGSRQDILICLAGTPAWASSNPGDTSCAGSYGGLTGCNDPPADVDSGDNIWKEFITALVQHSLNSPYGHIKYYELWNEPNLHEYWTGTPAQMATMARDAYSIIHGMDPDAQVLSPAPTHDPAPWLSAYFAAGGSAAQDIIAYHPFPEDGGGDPEDGLAWVDNTRALMQSYNMDLPIWATESDWQEISTLSNDQEEAWLAKQYILLLYKGVQRNYWYQWDNGSSSCMAPWGNLWTSSSGVCPAGIAYGQVYSWLAGSTPAKSPFCSKGADGTWTCDLVLSDGSPARILWNSTASGSVAVPPDFAHYRTLDSGAVYPVLDNSVSIGNKPIMVTK